MQQSRQATSNDPTMQTLSKVIRGGWPDTREEVPISTRSYWGFRDEITLQDGLIFKGKSQNRCSYGKFTAAIKDQTHAQDVQRM